MALQSKSISANGSKGHHKFTLTVTENSTSISGNTSSISWKLVLSSLGGGYDWQYSSTVPVTYKVVINGTSYSGNIMNYDGSSTVTIRSGSSTISHNNDGNKSISFSFSVSSLDVYYLTGSASASGSMTLTTIPRQATITSAPNFNDEENPTINYSNPAGYSVSELDVCISLDGSKDDIAYRHTSRAGTSYTFNLTDEERAILRNATTTSKSRTIKFYIRTKIGDNTYYSNVSKTLSIVNANPTTGTFTYKDTNAFTTNITENNQRIIRENSNLLFTVGTATALKGATISKYEVIFNDRTLSRTSIGDLNFGIINLSSNSNATLRVTDSRGNTATKQMTVIVDDWKLPTGTITLNRKNNFYSETYLKVDGTYSSLNGKNSMAIQYQYKKVTEKNFSPLYDLSDNVQTTLDLDNNYQWDIIVVVGDRIGETTYNLFLDRGMPIIFFDRLLNSVGINCFPTIAETLATSNLIQMHNGEVNVVGQKTLYENETGTTGTITLSESSAKFNYLEIFYKDNLNADVQSIRVANPNNKIVTLTCVEPSDIPRIYIRATRYTIVGTSITYVRGILGTIINNGSPTLSLTPYIYIVKVVGYK